MLALHTHAELAGPVPTDPLKVLHLQEALSSLVPFGRIAVLLEEVDEVDEVALQGLGFRAAVRPSAQAVRMALASIYSLRDSAVVASGDVIRVRPSGKLSVLFRRGANANSLFVTERCNNRCLMCSQPPRDEDDSWLVSEIFDLLPLIDRDLDVLGVSGGEPTLLGPMLGELIRRCRTSLPSTVLHILTNGRGFANHDMVGSIMDGVGHVIWAIPLFADVAPRHDYVVQAAGAFEETVNGIYNLGECGQRIEVRFVMHALTVPRIERFAEFVYRNMPFVEHVALMGLEPMGFAKVNREVLWMDPVDYTTVLTRAAVNLHNRGVAVSIYNVPLCVLPQEAWSLARRSISDWKNVFDPACEDCAVRSKCCGFFASHGSAWRSRGIKAFAQDEVGR